jgi:tetratricopeptide (TPR) repeat protein
LELEGAVATDFFISYTGADHAWAEWIAWQLEQAGYTTVLQAWDFRPGSNFILHMDRATREAEHTLIVLSERYLQARYTEPEWAAAFRADPTGEEGLLLPVRIDDCEIEGLLGSIIYIDLVGLEPEVAAEALLQGVRQGRGKPNVPPSFPRDRSAVKRSGGPRHPGSLPGTWNLRRARNPNFTGREALLAALRTGLTTGQPPAATQVITGLGGVGKTELVVEYAYRYQAEYDVIWWLRAEEPLSIASGYVELAQALELDEHDATDEIVVVEAARRWLEGHARWLLLFDNAPDPNALRPYLPLGAAGHVLITSRNPNWRGIASGFSLAVMDPSEAVAFLAKRTGGVDREGIALLAAALGYLPLALEQAGAYMEETGRDARSYIELVQRHRRELLGRGSRSSDYSDTLETTWELAMERVSSSCPAAAEMLNLLAFLAPDDFPLDLFSNGMTADDLTPSLAAASADPLTFDEAISALRRYSLIEVSQGACSVHRLVQAVTRDRLNQADHDRMAIAALTLVSDAFPFRLDDIDTWRPTARLVPHALAAAGYAEHLEPPPPTAAWLLGQAATFLRERAQFAAARTAFERALRIFEATYGPDHPEVATAVNNLGNCLQDLGDLAGARAAFERALRIDEATYGPNHPTVAIRVNNLGDLFQALGDLPAARAAFERALRIFESTYGPNHPDVARAVNNVGGVLHALGDLPGARAAFERALRIDEATYGPNHPSIAIHVNNLGALLQALGDLPAARAAFERALRIDEATYGLDHPDVATDVNNLGSIFQALGDLPAARAAFERALSVFEETLGDSHPSTLAIRRNLVSLQGQ